MSVESIANALFYLIMIAVVTLVASKVMQSGKMATTVSALSMLRSNIQYVGVNAGNYTNADKLILPQLIPGLVKGIETVPGTVDAGTGILPTGQTVTLTVAAAGDPDESGIGLVAPNDANHFKMSIAAVAPADCRKLAYYGLGAGYGVSVAGTLIVPTTTPATTVETSCGTAAAGVAVVLTSR